MISSAIGVNCTPLITQKINTTTIFISRFIRADSELAKTMMYFGKFILRIKSPRLIIDCRPIFVASVKNVHSTIPSSRYTPKCSMSRPRRKNFSNTIYKIANKNSGLKTDHKYPNTEPWYLSLKSVTTSSRKSILLRRENIFDSLIILYLL